MIDIYLCEDQAEQLRCLEKWISGYIEKNGTEARVVSARTHPEETLEDLSPGSTQLFFIDIQQESPGEKRGYYKHRGDQRQASAGNHHGKGNANLPDVPESG